MNTELYKLLVINVCGFVIAMFTLYIVWLCKSNKEDKAIDMLNNSMFLRLVSMWIGFMSGGVMWCIVIILHNVYLKHVLPLIYVYKDLNRLGK